MGPTTRDIGTEIFERLGIPTAYLAHLRELRSRLLRILFTVGFFYVIFFMFEFREVARAAGLAVYAPFFSPFHPAAAQVLSTMVGDLIPADVRLLQISPPEIVILYQFGRFVMPALYAHERRELVRLIIPGLVLFASGCFFAYRVVVPPIMNFLFEYSRELLAGSSGGFTVSVSIGQALEFSLVLVLAFGVVFEMPLLMGILTRLGVVEARTWRNYWRHALVGFLVVGGLITPDTSGVTQLLVALPMITLYFVGCALALLAERRAARAPVAAAV